MSEKLNELRTARETATRAKMALRHADDDAGDYLTFVSTGLDYTALGKNAESRKLAFNALMANDKKAQALERDLRDCQDTKDLADCELECLFDDIKAANNQTWAILADWVRGRTTSGRMGSVERAGKEMLKEQVEQEYKQAE